MGDDLDYAALAADAERKANSAETLHLAALWRERAETYRELAHYRGRRHEPTAGVDIDTTQSGPGGCGTHTG
jgi:hypothetical protein